MNWFLLGMVLVLAALSAWDGVTLAELKVRIEALEGANPDANS